ncbi:hypothetical protein [Streptomyces sp. NPDC005181]|uniref:hypothetical protein n=1 Tax=Streptomyces sp. NPDC005181 TaxID=3156869 RepID=UPI0033B3EB57
MRHTIGWAHTAPCGGLRAVVLLVLLAFVHSMFTPGPIHMPAPDADDCHRSIAASAADSPDVDKDCPVTCARVTTGEGRELPDGGAASVCDAAAYTPRPLSAAAHPAKAVVGAPVGDAPAGQGNAPACVNSSIVSGAWPSRTIVLRC